MGILDAAMDKLNQGHSAANRTAQSMKLKSQISDLEKRRHSLIAQLGEALYPVTMADPNFTTPFAPLYEAIAQVDKEHEYLDTQLAAIAAEAAAAKAASQGYSMQGAMGAQPAASAAPYTGPVCSNCGKPVGAQDAFCMSCGTKIEKVEVVEQAETIEPSSAAPFDKPSE